MPAIRGVSVETWRCTWNKDYSQIQETAILENQPLLSSGIGSCLTFFTETLVTRIGVGLADSIISNDGDRAFTLSIWDAI